MLSRINRSRKIGLGISLIVAILWTLTAPTLLQAVTGSLLVSIILFSTVQLIHYLVNKNWKKSGAYALLTILSIGVLVFSVLSLATGFDNFGRGMHVANNPLTGQCAVELTSSDNPFPWYYQENGCDVTQTCKEPIQNEKFCKELRNSAPQCKHAIDSVSKTLDTGETAEIPETCFRYNVSLSSKLPTAEKGDMMRKTDTGKMEVVH